MKSFIIYYLLFTSFYFSQELPSDKYWRFGENSTIFVLGDTLFSQNGYILEIHDISDKKNPVWISSTQLQDNFSSIKVWDHYAFCLLNSKQLVIVDIRNLESLRILKVFGDEIVDFNFYNDKLILARGESGFSIYDLSDLSNPQVITSYTYDESYNFKGIEIYNKQLYFNCSDHILIFETLNFPHVSIISNIDLSDSIDGYISIKKLLPIDNFIYVSAYTRGLITIDISDIDNSKITSITKYDGIEKDYSYQDMIIKGNSLFVGTCFYQVLNIFNLIEHFGNGIHVFDISERSAPIERTKIFFTDSYLNQGFILRFSNDKKYLFATLSLFNGYCSINIESIDNAYQTGEHLNASIRKFVPHEDYIYYVGGNWGLGILNNRISSEITELKRINLNGNASLINKHGEYLFVGIEDLGIQILTIDQPGNPQYFSFINSEQSNFYYSESRLITWDRKSIKLYNLEDISNPILINEFCHRTYYYEQILDVKSFDDFIIVIPDEDREKIEIIDISDPDFPVVKHEMLLNYYKAPSFQKSNNFLVIKDFSANYIFDVTDLSNIELVHKNYFPPESSFAIRGEILYLFSNTLSVYDVSDFDTPTILAEFSYNITGNYFFRDNYIFNRNGPYGTELNVYRINSPTDITLLESKTIGDSYLSLSSSVLHQNSLISWRYGGLEVFLFDNVTSIKNNVRNANVSLQLKNYPNPFNPITTIEYSIPSIVNHEESIVRLTVFDVLGREVTTLVNNHQPPGKYEVKFDASSLSSGVYFYRLLADKITLTKKMMLLE